MMYDMNPIKQKESQEVVNNIAILFVFYLIAISFLFYVRNPEMT